jgi:tetratricopeptide (TPR) repeat protein
MEKTNQRMHSMLTENLPDFDSLWDYAQPDQTEIKFRAILLQIPEDDPALLELLTQIARAQGLQHKFEKAHQTLDQVERRLGGVASRPQIRYLLERGRLYNSSGDPEQSRPYFEQALDLATQLNEDFYAVDALHMLAIVAPPDQALTLNRRAIKRAESSADARARSWLGSLYNNLGWAYHDQAEYASALEAFEKAESYRRAKGSVPEIRVAVWCVARALRSLKRFDEALSKQMALKAEFEAAGESDGFVFEEIAECLWALKRTEQARPYFVQAFDVLSQDVFLAEQEPERFARLKKLGRST